MLVAMGLTATSFVSCDEETTKEFLTDVYLAQADHYVVTAAKSAEGDEYVAWADFFENQPAPQTTFKFLTSNMTCEVTGYFAPTGNGTCTFSGKGDYVTIYLDGKEYLRMTLLKTESKMLEAKIQNLLSNTTTWVKMDRILK